MSLLSPQTHIFRLPQINLGLAERKALLTIGDLLTTNGVLAYTLWQRNVILFTWDELWRRLPWFLLFTTLWLLIGLAFNVYDPVKATDIPQSVQSVMSATLLTTILYLFIPYWPPPLPVRRLEIFLFPFIAMTGVGLWRFLYVTVFAQPNFNQKVLVIGAGRAGRTLADSMSSHDNDDNDDNSLSNHISGYRIIGFVDDDPKKKGVPCNGIPVLGSHCDLVDIVNAESPDLLVLSITHPETIQAGLFQAILECRKMGIQVTTMASLYEQLSGRVPVEHAGHNLNVVFSLNQSGTYRLYLILRRLFDLWIGILGCFWLLIVIPFAWLANRISSPGPLFFYQERVGQGGQTFRIVKFRSMIVDAEQNGAVWATEDDPRITSIGHFLRKTRLDELPQFWNILRGDMSLIGPRPERPIFVEKLEKQIPFYQTRHAVKPGLTGWAQVRYRYGASVEDALIKLQYDLYYVKHQTWLLDLQIAMQTIGVVLGFKGR